ncbi:MAG: carboxypeptidase-like regulatory domain-containing protein, partial [Planctomycetota bacterium]
MDGVRTSAWWWLCAALVAVAAKAQEPQRRPLLGRVLDATGAPLEHAQVMFVGLESGLAVDTARDVVEATSGDRGRYRAMLLPGLPYFGFACGPTTADGQMTFAEVRGWFGAGAIVDFRCTSSAPLQTAAIRGLEAWNDDGPLQRFVRPSFHGGYLPMPFAIAAPSAADGSSPWPSMPRGFVELRRADGSMFWISPPALDPGKDFVVPPPREVRCRVVDTAGAPVSGASLHLRTLASHDGLVDGIETMRGVFEYPVGTTGKDGVAVLRLPFPDDAPPGT